MVEWIELHMWGAASLRARASFKYELLARLARSAKRAQVELLCFGLSDEVLRVLLVGTVEGRSNVLRGVKVGTVRRARAQGERLLFVETVREVFTGELPEAVAQIHGTPLRPGESPLESPWSSHRDLLGFRVANFYDPSPLRARVDTASIHRACGGGPLPLGWPPTEERPSIELILRVAAAVIGVFPADPACFALFVQVGRDHGYGNEALAAALNVTQRRVRQLLRTSDERRFMVETSLADQRLRQVP
ncbi:MAG: hypothetical protein EA397_19125 [Deltaproteobacteria bacterium]|nr:MAG: hypothetical protein EA397_19125 [Deltaproteobacteria bacterium]